jgi:histone acetyltransferase HTATIP
LAASSCSSESSKIEKRSGSPEQPLSDLRLMTDRSYWKEDVIQCFIEHQDEAISVNAISTYAGMTIEHIRTAIKDNKFLQSVDGEWIWALINE